ncbi:MAG: hypothetical protein HN509_13745 [Halobacteriovoraceae bacterium]|jgi:hypothetical protein|nr:hypothetical protein [Halobacteriovoraceae bacterium]MBT5094168.1 hypothetical protein [Halobacteriovoraceae bacterium]
MAKNILLALCSTLLLFTSLEVGLFYYLPHLPLKYHVYLSRLHRPLAQDFKRGTLPLQYTALFGDSYAQGMGGWLETEDQTFKQGLHTAAILHKKLKSDFITFGEGGLGSLTGLLNRPYHLIRESQKHWGHSLNDPKNILLLFYGGNDLNNNLAELKSFGGDSRSLAAVIEESVISNKDFLSEYGEEKILSWFNFSIALPFFGKLLKERLGVVNLNSPAAPVKEAAKIKTRALIADQEVQLPDFLQSPALDLSVPQKEKALAVFVATVERLKKEFPNSKIGILYIPSVLGCYQMVGEQVSIEVYQKGGESYHSVSKLREGRDYLASRMAKLASDLELPFVDAGVGLRKVARQKLIHGPSDWHHFNNAGYRQLSLSAELLLGKL